ncbi:MULTISPECIES: sensor histidine kinase [Alphaproteobacteria]|uniref:histidine kinase n=2 Tax=Alphaproteobacteria TaxID=28211 RepID=A0A512HDZ1_9HYPH|nr:MULTISPECIES: histidine kinase dimerization/phosphoacceptor domain -containing protein [Alphaproteobacteria]GEO83673.1 two-component system sensor histidine kinase/response regulator [Ciceribacter naphthalenivorans]GLR24175.1 two-component system sensor histidine kinase/response regulator [Ciceribacter naphthalenivorans]GLT07031.1 two-component system sensor histidine kinase/response regulator [Sphingomonas psychrolutea]
MSIRILYLDDDAAIVRLVDKAVARLGYRLTHAETPEQALALLNAESFDILVLDHYLQNVTGHEVLRRLRARDVILPVVYVTGSNEAQVAIEAIRAGASDYVIKTVSDDFMPLLISAIEHSVANAQLRAAKERAEEEIRLAKERAEALLGEVNHRVANSLALVASLLRLQISNSKNPDVKSELAETQARITAIAGMHRSLYTSDDVSRVELDRYLRNLTSELSGSLQNPEKPLHLTLDADPISITADRAVSIGMIVTELVTNAYKYAYTDKPTGEIRIRLKRTGDNAALLRVEDDGVGMQLTSAPTGTGLGSRIVKSMASTLGPGISYLETHHGTIAEMPLVIAIAQAPPG